MRFISSMLLMLAGCTHAGTGQGTLEASGPTGAERAEGPVNFSWKSGIDASEGTIAATLSDGRRFEGTYLQPTSNTLEPSYSPYYATFSNRRWGTMAPWYTGPQTEFVTHYSGKVIAHLKSPDGTSMRCTFVLRVPESGLSGGATGDCQLSTKESVFGAEIHAS